MHWRSILFRSTWFSSGFLHILSFSTLRMCVCLCCHFIFLNRIKMHAHFRYFPWYFRQKRDTFAQRITNFERCIEDSNAFAFDAYDIFPMNNSNTFYTFYRQKDSDRFGLWVKWVKFSKWKRNEWVQFQFQPKLLDKYVKGLCDSFAFPPVSYTFILYFWPYFCDGKWKIKEEKNKQTHTLIRCKIFSGKMSLFRIYEESERKRDPIEKRHIVMQNVFRKMKDNNKQRKREQKTNDVRRNPESETIFFRTSIIHVQRIERH